MKILGVMMGEELIVPTVNADSLVYWQEAGRGKLMIRMCRTCERTHFIPRYLCPFCWSDSLEWVQSSGRGTVHSFTIMRRAPLPAFAAKVPYVVALIDLAEGPRMMANVVGPGALHVNIGDSVQVTFDDVRDGVTVPQFALAPAG